MSDATELRLDGAEIQRVQVARDGKILVEILARWQGQIPEEYVQVRPASLHGLRLGTEGDDVTLRVARLGDLKAMDTKKRIKVVCTIPGLLGEFDSRIVRLLQWMQAQEDHAQWRTAPDKSRGAEPLVPAVEWLWEAVATQGELWGGVN